MRRRWRGALTRPCSKRAVALEAERAKRNEEIADLEFQRNTERYRFLKWGQQAFRNFTVVPPATGIVHQVNLEYHGWPATLVFKFHGLADRRGQRHQARLFLLLQAGRSGVLLSPFEYVSLREA